VKQAACEALLQHRSQIKLKGKHMQDVANRVHLALPVKRDDKERPPVVMDSVEEDREVARERLEEWEHERELFLNFDPEYTGIDWRKRYDLEDESWRFDAIPEIMDGKNVLDFWAPDIEERLSQLEREEQARVRIAELEKEDDVPGLTPEQMAKVKKIREKRILVIQANRLKRGTSDVKIATKFGTDTSKDLAAFQEHLESLGLDGKDVTARIRARSKSRPRSESRGLSRGVSQSRVGRKRTRDELESRGLSVSRKSASSFKDEKQKGMAERLAKKARKELAQDGRLGESDRHIFDLKPKHLFSGKRGIGSTDRR